jgi:hypothetical protein
MRDAGILFQQREHGEWNCQSGLILSEMLAKNLAVSKIMPNFAANFTE